MMSLMIGIALLAGSAPRGKAIVAINQGRMESDVEAMRPLSWRWTIKDATSSGSSSVGGSKKSSAKSVKKTARRGLEANHTSPDMDRMTVFISLDASGPSLPVKMLWATRPGLIKKRNMLLEGQQADGLQKFCSDTVWGPGNHHQRCAKMPNNTFVKASRFGYCEAMSAAKNCTYLAMVQDPVASTVQSYNSYCLGCAHQGLFCTNRGNGCPNLSIVGWAEARNNILTRSFATKMSWPNANTTWTLAGQPVTIGDHDLKARKGKTTGAEFLVPVTEEDYRRAMRHIRRPNVQPISVEELNIGQRGRSNGITALGNLLGTPIMDLAWETVPERVVARLNSSMEKMESTSLLSYLPTKHELEQIQRIMKYDILLYKALFGKSNEAR